MSVDPTAIAIESHTAPIWEQESSFHELMADQVKHAPWLGLAIVLHALALFVLMSLDFTVERPPEKKLTINLPEQKQSLEEPPKPKVDPVIEKTLDKPVLRDSTVDKVADVTESFDAMNNPWKDASTDHTAWNSAVGPGGGAGGPYGNRGGGGDGGKPIGRATHEALERGLKWLVDHQDDDGRWDSDGFMKHDDPARGPICDGAGNSVHDVGLTGLALLAFLGEGSTLRAGAYREQIKGAVRWLREQQKDSGLYGGNASQHFIYDHAIAAYAMVEACGLSESKMLEKYAQRGLDYLESHRNAYGVWRYRPRDNDNDTSVTGWCVMAYKSGKHFGLSVNDRALAQCEVWLDEVTDPVTGRHGYSKRGELSSRHPGPHAAQFPREKGEAMTGVGLFCRYFMQQDPKEHDVMQTAAELLASKPPVWDEASGAIDHYYWYYASYALYQAGGSHWNTWSKALDKAVIPNQHGDNGSANLLGSWDPVGAWGEDGGRVYSTSLLVLTLQVHFRYSRLVR